MTKALTKGAGVGAEGTEVRIYRGTVAVSRVPISSVLAVAVESLSPQFIGFRIWLKNGEYREVELPAKVEPQARQLVHEITALSAAQGNNGPQDEPFTDIPPTRIHPALAVIVIAAVVGAAVWLVLFFANSGPDYRVASTYRSPDGQTAVLIEVEPGDFSGGDLIEITGEMYDKYGSVRVEFRCNTSRLLLGESTQSRLLGYSGALNGNVRCV